MTLIFKEPETFTTPDGGEYVVLPVQVDDMPILFSITNKRNKLSKKKKGTIEGEEFIKECGTDLTKLIDRTILHIQTGEPLPPKYRQMSNILELVGKIMKITTIEVEDEKDDGTPLEQKPKSSVKSSPVKPT